MGHKFTWSAEWRDDKTWQLIAPPAFVKIDTRPQMTIEETAVHTCGTKGVVWMPGKASWNETKITYDDVENDEGGALFMRWVSEQYRALDTTENRGWQSERATVVLRLHGGNGEVLEVWYLEDSFISSLDFGCPGYTSSLDYELNVAVRYSDVSYSTPDPATWMKPLT